MTWSIAAFVANVATTVIIVVATIINVKINEGQRKINRMQRESNMIVNTRLNNIERYLATAADPEELQPHVH